MKETVVYKMSTMAKPGDFEEVYALTYPLLYRIVYRITGESMVSDDLCQEAFIRYYKRTIVFPSTKQARYWLIRVVTNLALNYEKRKRREKRAYDRYLRESKQNIPSGETELLRNESAKIVQASIKKLPLKLRTVIVMKEFGDMSYREISRTLGISESNVKVRVFRARQQLKRYLDEEELYVS